MNIKKKKPSQFRPKPFVNFKFEQMKQRKKPMKCIRIKRKRILIYKHNVVYLYKKKKTKTAVFLNKPKLQNIRYPFKLNFKLVNEYIKKY